MGDDPADARALLMQTRRPTILRSSASWRKQPGGSWKCVADTWNNNPTQNVFPEKG